jgi:hypothetical protein
MGPARFEIGFEPELSVSKRLDHILLMARRHCEPVSFVPKADILDETSV